MYGSRLPSMDRNRKYSVCLLVPKSDTNTVSKIKAAIEVAHQERSDPSSSRATERTYRSPSLPSRIPLRGYGDAEHPGSTRITRAATS